MYVHLNQACCDHVHGGEMPPESLNMPNFDISGGISFAIRRLTMNDRDNQKVVC